MSCNTPKKENKIIKSGHADDNNLPASIRDQITAVLVNMNEANISKTLVGIFSQAEIEADFVKYIQRGTVYLAEVPKKLQKDFTEGKLQFMKIKATGEQVGEIVGQNNFGNKGHVIIKDAGILHSNIPHDLTTIAMQQQFAQMAVVLDDVRSRVVELQKTYDESLLGELRGMSDQLRQVQNANNIEIQKDFVKGAITQINLTRGRITQRLLSEINKMPNVPETMRLKIFRIITKEGFRDSVISGYEKIQELFGYYLAASQLLSYAYALLDEQDLYQGNYEDIFTPNEELLREESLSNLKRCEDIVGVAGERWYSCPSKFLGYIKKEAHNVFLSQQDAITIEVTGDQLLEAIESAREE